jgi:branched-chain amino acid transport system permease protein
MIANLIVGGLAAGCLYAMVGIAIVIVLNITDIANFAQGEMAMVTTFFAYWLMDGVGLAWWQAVSIAIVFGLVQGIVIQQVMIRPLIGGPVLSAIIATLGLNVVLNSLAGLIWGHQTYTFPSPFAFSPPFLIGGVHVSVDSVVNIAVGLVIIICMTLFLRFTWTGLSLRAASQNQTVARLMGVSITKSSAIAWGLGGLVGGIAGILVAPSLFLDTNLMSALLIKAFAGGVLGGLNSLIGVFFGCLALGVAENLAGAYLSPSFADAITFIIIIAVLTLRPEGIFGRVKVRKA